MWSNLTFNDSGWINKDKVVGKKNPTANVLNLLRLDFNREIKFVSFWKFVSTYYIRLFC